jgi:hypothetical protein
LENPGFEEGLDFWSTYGRGLVESASLAAYRGSYSARIQRSSADGHFFGLYQEEILVEPNTEYRLSLRVKTNAGRGYVAAGLGVWSNDSNLNHHSDFGYIRGTKDWVTITGTWKSRPYENVIRVMLFGSPDFTGEAYFDDLVLQEAGPFEVTLSGPSLLGYKQASTYAAKVSYGSGNYSYQWYRKYDGQSAWSPVGTAQKFTAHMLNKGFTLRVDVTDNVTGVTGSATRHVEYEGGSPVKKEILK